MSRRARRRRGEKKNWSGRFMLIVGVVLVVGSGVGFLALRAYLHSDGFRQFLSQMVSKALQVDGRFSPFTWDGLAVETDGFEGKSEGLVSSIKVERVGTEVGFGGVGRGVWEIKATRMSRIDVFLDLTKEKKELEKAQEEEVVRQESKPKGKSWVPSRVELESIEIGEVALEVLTKKGMASAKGMKVMVMPERVRDSYRAEISGGNVELPFRLLPPLRVDEILCSYSDGSIFLTKADVGGWKNGRISAGGEWNLERGQYAFDGRMDRVKCDEVLSEDWSKRLTGDVSSTFVISNRTGKVVTSGKLEVQNGVLTALPLLDALAAYADTRRFRVLQLNEARTNWRYSEGELVLSDFVLGSEGLMRIEGNLAMRDRKIEGRFLLGIVPGTLSTIPGAETHVFQPGSHGLLWAPIHITGTLDDPKEDLTNRLIAAAGVRMFEQIPETGEKVFKFTRNALAETPGQVIDTGKVILDGSGKVIEEGGKVIEDATGIFRGLLGN